MDSLLKSKKEIIEKNLPALQERMIEANNQILKSLDKALEDNKISADIKIDILERLKIGQIKVDRESTTGMKSEDKYQLAKLYFENAKDMMESLREDKEFVKSYMNSIDEQIKMTQDEINRIDQEILDAIDKEQVDRLKEEKDKKIYKW